MKFQRSSGILLHPTSLPGKFGIGDLGKNAYIFVDFLEKASQSLWQMLPIGPTSFGDSPYQSFSTFAGNPLLISPGLLCEKGYLSQIDIEDTPNFLPTKINYDRVQSFKKILFEKAYIGFLETATKEQTTAFSNFCMENSYWLDDYALFVSLKDYFIEQRKYAGFTKEFKEFSKNTKTLLTPELQKDYYFGGVWSTWPKELLNRDKDAIKDWSEKLSGFMNYYKFLQFEFFNQWFALKKYANDKGIKLIGDVPIFVAYDSTDTWAHPKNYFMDERGFPTVVAGVPPDYFSETGQLWGNPLYNFKYHEKSNYSWWIERINHTLKFVDILRIDHFRGFDSYWAVPFGDIDATGGTWEKGAGASFFTALKNVLGDIPIIAEDLGILTDSVRNLRKSCGFPGMKVLQFAFSDSPKNDYLPHNFEQNAVVYTGTHDNDTSLGWYEKATEKERDHFRRYSNVSGQTVSWDFIRLALSSTAVFSIFPLQDVLSLGSDARMNIPSVSSGNWQYRFLMSDLKDEYADGLSYLTTMFNRNTLELELQKTKKLESDCSIADS